MGIRFILMVNKQGQTRLAQYYEYLTIEERRALEGEMVRKCLARNEQQVLLLFFLFLLMLFSDYFPCSRSIFFFFFCNWVSWGSKIIISFFFHSFSWWNCMSTHQKLEQYDGIYWIWLLFCTWLEVFANGLLEHDYILNNLMVVLGVGFRSLDLGVWSFFFLMPRR